MSKMIQSDGFICNKLGNLGKNVIIELAIILAKNKLGLVNRLASLHAKIKVESNIGRKGVLRAGKVFTLFISNGILNEIIKTIKLLEDSNVLIDGLTKKVRYKVKKREGWFLPALLTLLDLSLMQPMIYSVVKSLIGAGLSILVPLHPLSNIDITKYLNYDLLKV